MVLFHSSIAHLSGPVSVNNSLAPAALDSPVISHIITIHFIFLPRLLIG
jgi:hypothetical protein